MAVENNVYIIRSLNSPIYMRVETGSFVWVDNPFLGYIFKEPQQAIDWIAELKSEDIEINFSDLVIERWFIEAQCHHLIEVIPIKEKSEQEPTKSATGSTGENCNIKCPNCKYVTPCYFFREFSMFECQHCETRFQEDIKVLDA